MSNISAIHKRQNDLILFMKTNKVTVQDMSKYTGLSMETINGYIDGKFAISPGRWHMIKIAMERYHTNIVPPPAPKVSNKSIIPEFVIESLSLQGNTIILKKKIKKREQQFLDELLKRGFNCRIYDTGDDHWVIEDKERYTKTT